MAYGRHAVHLRPRTRRHTVLSIAICTHNRSADVAICMEHLHPQIDFAVAELVVVDSASSPEEAQALDLCVQACPNARLIRLSEPGISLARNVALAATSGEWLAFLDDDAIPRPDWFRNVRRLAAIAPEDCAIVGGDIAPAFPEGMRPRLGRRWRQYLSLIDQPDESFTASDAAVCGVNSLYRRAYLLDCQGFPQSLGRVGTTLLSGEEKLVQEIALLNGWKVGRSDRMRVAHRVPASRLRRRWVTRRAFWDGVSDERIRAILGARTGGLELVGLALRLPVLALLYPFLPVRQEFFLRLWYTLGRLRECLRGVPAAATDARGRPAAPPRGTAQPAPRST